MGGVGVGQGEVNGPLQKTDELSVRMLFKVEAEKIN